MAATLDEALLGPAIVLALTAGNVVPARAATPPGVVDRVGMAMRRAPGEYGVFVAHTMDPSRLTDRDADDEGDDRSYGDSQDYPGRGSQEQARGSREEAHAP